MFSSRLPLTGIMLFLSIAGTSAETVEELSAIMNKVPKMCRFDYPIYSDVSYSICEGRGSSAELSNCQNDVSRRNKIIWKWNSFVRACKARNNNDASSGTSRGSPQKGTQGEISKRLEAATKKAADDRATTQEYQQNLLQDERAAVMRQKVLKEEGDAISRRDQELREERRQYREAQRLNALHRAQIQEQIRQDEEEADGDAAAASIGGVMRG